MTALSGKGNCFHVAADLVLSHAGAGLTLCHGTPIAPAGPHEGERLYHAWAETDDGRVIDRSNGNDVNLPRDAYYRLGRIDPAEVLRYSRLEVAALSLRFGHWGPWHETTWPCGWLVEVATEDGPTTRECGAPARARPDDSGWDCENGHEHTTMLARARQGWDYFDDDELAGNPQLRGRPM
jgi:hypothetical protein